MVVDLAEGDGVEGVIAEAALFADDDQPPLFELVQVFHDAETRHFRKCLHQLRCGLRASAQAVEDRPLARGVR